ncbi:radical SAM protein [Candidatus Saganbacteria bacterium]|nr:radical SAM protein [Candidatus Saganbacteria bacterium]
MSEKLDCLLISPPIHHKDNDNIWKGIDSNFPPLGLADMAGYIRDKNYSVSILDCNVECSSVESFGSLFKKEFVDKYVSIKIIGLTTLTCNIKKAYGVAQICKKYYPDAIFVFGGVHATFVADEVIRNDLVDIVVCGEGENTLHELVAGKDLEMINGIIFKKKINGKQEIVKNPSRQRITDLNSLPMPAYDLLPISKYKPAKGSYKRLPAMSMMTSRGCPGKCSFCSKTLGNRLVFKSAEKIFREINYLIQNYGIKQILFYDDTFTAFRKNVMELCDLIVENKTDISWTCFARVDFVDLGMLEKMKQAGCHQIMYGVESIDENVLRKINKKTNINQVVNASKWTKQAGIECRVAFMVGNPGDDEEIIKKNIRFVNKLNPDILIVNITTPFPGTEMFAWAKENNLILTYDWDDYNLAKPVMRLKNLTSDQIKALYKLMYQSFYFRPAFILRKLFRIRSLSDIKILLSGLKAVFSLFQPKGGTARG